MKSTITAALSVVLLMSCSMGDDTDKEENDWWDEADTDTDTDTDTDSDTDTDTDPDDGYDPEEESPYIELEPVAVSQYVFVANDALGTITRVDSDTLKVLTADIGSGPKVMAASASQGLVAVLAERSEQVDIVDVDTLEVSSVPIRDELNQLVLSPDGRWAICWYSASADSGSVDDSTWSWNEISVVDLLAGEDHPHVVGFQPRDVAFDDSGELAVVVSDAWLAVLDLSGDEPVIDRIQIAEDTVEPPLVEEVVVDPLGQYAVVRVFQTRYLLLVDLLSGEISELDVGANATDLDVSPDGTWFAAVARASGQLWIYDLFDPMGTEPQVLALPDEAVLGSLVLSDSGEQGLLYSTATDEAVFASWDVLEGRFDLHGSVKPISGVRISPSSASALLLHPTEGGTTGTPFYNRPAITVVELHDHFTNPVRLSKSPTDFVDSADGRYGYFLQEGIRSIDVVDYDSLLVDEVPLQSVPVDLGIMPGTHTVFASQTHSLGRLSFYDPDEETLQTITGFELNGAVEE